MLVIVPDYLADELNRRLDAEIEAHPGAAAEREALYGQLMDYVHRHGVVPDFSLARLSPEAAQ